MDRYAVIGNPVAHSLSPEIHARFAREAGEAISYSRLLVPEGAFAEHARRFFDEGARGANVTLPFKEDAWRFAQRASARAARAGAANFLAREGDAIVADNTDGAGLVADLVGNLGIALEGARILVLGAGGAARGVLGPLLERAPRRVVIANRTVARAQDLAARFRGAGAVEAVAMDAIPAEDFDLVLNATSGGTRGEAVELPAHVPGRGAFAYDMAYGAAARPFLARAAAAGARGCDGLGMLVEQAAESFFLWRGKRPRTAALLAELRQRLA